MIIQSGLQHSNNANLKKVFQELYSRGILHKVLIKKYDICSLFETINALTILFNGFFILCHVVLLDFVLYVKMSWESRKKDALEAILETLCMLQHKLLPLKHKEPDESSTVCIHNL